MTPSPKDPQAELREAVEEIIDRHTLEWKAGHNHLIVEQVMAVFQAREQYCDAVPDDQPNDVHIQFFNNGFRTGQQQLLDELLGELSKKYDGGVTFKKPDEKQILEDGKTIGRNEAIDQVTEIIKLKQLNRGGGASL